MANSDNVAGFVIQADFEEFKKQVIEYEKRLGRMEQKTEETTSSIGNLFKKIGGLMAGYMSVQALTNFTKKLIEVRGQFQQLEIAFTTMLGSQEKANALMKQLTDTAAKTPFDMQSIAQGAKQLLAYGEASENVNDTLVRLGNIASGLSIPLNDLVYLYGTTQVQGRVFAQDIRQFLGRGIPIVKELATQFGVAEGEISKMVTNGEVGFEHIKKALESMTNEGGMFFNLMEKQSASLTGQVSNLEDAIDMMLNEIGTDLQDVLAGGISFTSKLVENYRTIGKVVASMVTIYGAYKTALIINNALEEKSILIAKAKNRILQIQQVIETKLATLRAMNPYVAIGMAITALVALMVIWKNRVDEQDEAQAKLNKRMDDANEAIKKNMELTDQHVAVIQDKTAEVWKQVEAYRELQKYENSVTGMSMEQIQGMSKSEKENLDLEYRNSKRVSEAQKLLAEAKERYQKAVEGEKNASKYDTSGSAVMHYMNMQKEALKDIQVAQANLNKVIKDNESFSEEVAWNRMSAEQKLIKLKQEEAELDKKRLETGSKIEELQKKQSEFGGNLTNWEIEGLKAQNAEYEKLINLNKKKQSELERQNEKQVKDYNYWAELKKKATENYHASAYNSEEFHAYKKQIDEATKMMKLWEDQTKKNDEATKNLRKSLDDMIFSLQQQAKLEGKTGFDLQRQQNENDRAEKQRENEKWKEEQLNVLGLNDADKKKINEVYEETKRQYELAYEITMKTIADDEKVFIHNLNSEINDYWKSDLERELKSIDDWAKEQVKQIEENITDATEKAKKKAELDSVTEAKKEDAVVNNTIQQEEQLLELKLKELEVEQQSRTTRKQNLLIQEATEESLMKRITALENQKVITDSEMVQIQMLKLELEQVQKKKDEIKKDMTELSNTIISIGESLGNSTNSSVSNIGSVLSSIGNNYNSYKEMSKMNKGEAIQAGIKMVVDSLVQFANMIRNQKEENKQALESWYDAVRSSAHKLALMRIDEYEYVSKNMFGVDNPYDKIQASLNKQNQAYSETSDALQKLAKEGQVQTGTKKVVKGSNVAEGAGVGASMGIGTMIAIGAAMGSAATPIGTAIGAVAGAIAGTFVAIFAAKETVPIYESLTQKYGEIYSQDTLEINKEILADYDKMDDATKKLIDNAQELLEKQKEAKEEYENYIKDMVGEIGNALRDDLVEAFTGGDVYDAVDSFTEHIREQMEDIISQKVFSALFQKQFDNLTTQLQTGNIGDEGYIENIEEILSGLPSEIDGKLKTYQQIMQSYKDAFSRYGLFTGENESVQDALSGTIASMSEDTGSKINGNFMGLKLTAMEINGKVGYMQSLAESSNEMMNRSLSVMNDIALNTSYCKKLERLEDISFDLKEMRQNGVMVR